jgi:pimeloyl-ACP methyl ester carboxylesterase
MPLSEASPSGAPERLTRPDGSAIAYHKTPGSAPGIVFLGGFMSDMTGSKALSLEGLARQRGHAFLRFDYQGHGASSGRFEDGTIGSWTEDAVAALDALTEGPQVLVGSSMGGWIMLLAALARPQRVAGLLGIAAAPDFTEDLMWDAYPQEVRETLRRDGVYHEPSDYGDAPYAITMRLIDEGREHLLLRAPIPIACPVRLIHGMADPDVPWQTSIRLAERLHSHDVEITLVKAGGHRLSEPEDLDRLCRTLEDLIGKLG